MDSAYNSDNYQGARGTISRDFGSRRSLSSYWSNRCLCCGRVTDGYCDRLCALSVSEEALGSFEAEYEKFRSVEIYVVRGGLPPVHF